MRPEAVAALARDVVGRDGTVLRLRAIRPDDAPRLVALYDRLSRDSRYHRFFSVMRRLPPDWATLLATVDFVKRAALVLARDADGGGEIVGVARYEPGDAPDEVEVAFVVEDAWQGQGLGRLLVRELARAVAANGFRRLRAYVLADNRPMLTLLAAVGRVVTRTVERGVVTLVIELPQG